MVRIDDHEPDGLVAAKAAAVAVVEVDDEVDDDEVLADDELETRMFF